MCCWNRWRCLILCFFLSVVQVRRSLRNSCRTWRIRTCRNFCPVSSRTQHNHLSSCVMRTWYSASHSDNYYNIYLNNTQHKKIMVTDIVCCEVCAWADTAPTPSRTLLLPWCLHVVTSTSTYCIIIINIIFSRISYCIMSVFCFASVETVFGLNVSCLKGVESTFF